MSGVKAGKQRLCRIGGIPLIDRTVVEELSLVAHLLEDVIALDVTEPMGMEMLIYFTLEGVQMCGRVSPNLRARDGGPLRLAVDLNNMHLLNEMTGAVI